MRVNKYLPYVLIAISCYLSQLVLMYLYAPTESDFKVDKVISGKYLVYGGDAGMRTTTEVNGVFLICIINYMGPVDSCNYKFRDELVEVKLASYRHVFGVSSVVMEITSKDGQFTKYIDSYSVDKRIKLWWKSSILRSILYSFILLILLGSCFYKFINKGKKNGN